VQLSLQHGFAKCINVTMQTCWSALMGKPHVRTWCWVFNAHVRMVYLSIPCKMA